MCSQRSCESPVKLRKIQPKTGRPISGAMFYVYWLDVTDRTRFRLCIIGGFRGGQKGHAPTMLKVALFCHAYAVCYKFVK